MLKNRNEKIQIVIKEEGITLGGVSMTGGVVIVKRNIFQRIGDFFRKKK